MTAKNGFHMSKYLTFRINPDVPEEVRRGSTFLTVSVSIREGLKRREVKGVRTRDG